MDTKTIIKMILLVGLGGFLASRLFSGTLNFYIHPRFNGLTLATAVILCLLGVGYWWQVRQQTAEEGHHHAHDIPWSGLFILALPILLGLFVQPKPLGANALGNRELNFSLTSAQGDNLRASTIETDGSRNILDWLYDFQREQNPELFNDREAEVVGFVYRDERFGETQFMVSRFTISCCVADANPVGLIVEFPDGDSLAADSWVQVNGRFSAQTFNGQTIPLLIAETVTAVDAPSQPYLYE